MKPLRQPLGQRGIQRLLALWEAPRELQAPKEGCPPSQVCLGFLILLWIFCFSLSSDLCRPFSQKHKAAPVALAPLKAVKRGAQSTTGSARPKSPPLLSRDVGEPRREGEGQ